jgi:hypothetical protein
MSNEKTQTITTEEQQFPTRILYSSPPEASNLRAWVREVERKRNGNGSPPQGQADSD